MQYWQSVKRLSILPSTPAFIRVQLYLLRIAMPVLSCVALTLCPMAVQIPLIGWIGRLDHQKGPDIVLDAVPGVAQRGCQVHGVHFLVALKHTFLKLAVYVQGCHGCHVRINVHTVCQPGPAVYGREHTGAA